MHTYPNIGVYTAIVTASNSASAASMTTTVTITENTFCNFVSDIPKVECEALVALYAATDGNNWTDNSGWLVTTTPCSWYGVTCGGGHIEELDLHNNQLSGTIPPELGSLANLQLLYLGSNVLEGEVPASVTNLTNLYDDYGADISYNKLWASNPSVVTFLNTKDSDWADTQTVPPTDLQTPNIDRTSITLSWTPIIYILDGGYYEIGVAITETGPYTVHGTTTDKSAMGYLVDGLSPDTSYYLRVCTFTPAHGEQLNDLWSDYTQPVSATTTSTAELRYVYLPLVMRKEP